MSEIKKKKKKKKCCCSNSSSSNNSSNNSSSDSSNNQSNSNDKTSKLCYFSSLDYIVLASTLSIALGEELSTTDINILSTFFAVLSDELALIGSVDSCNSGGDDDVFVSPVPDVAMTTSEPKNKKNSKKKKIKKKK